MAYEARLHEDPQWIVHVAGDPFDVICCTSQGDDEQKARRIAACLNACEGIDPAVVVEMRAACEFALKAIVTNDPIAAAEQLRRTIAKARGAAS